MLVPFVHVLPGEDIICLFVEVDIQGSQDSGELFLGNMSSICFIEVLEGNLNQHSLCFDHVFDISQSLVKEVSFLLGENLLRSKCHSVEAYSFAAGLVHIVSCVVIIQELGVNILDKVIVLNEPSLLGI